MSASVPIIDSHAHAWPRWPYAPPVPDDAQRGAVEQLLWEMDASGVAQAVLVAADIDRNPDNNDYVAAQVARFPDRLHHVAAVDCRWSPQYHAPGAAARLNAIIHRFRPAGITHYLAAEPDLWLTSRDGLEFFAAAAEHGLAVGIAGGPEWQPQLRALARALPALRIVCHHMAQAHSTSGPRDAALAETLRTLECPNVFLKVSGFAYGAVRAWGFPYPDAQEVLRRLYQGAGARRLCWGSDYPVLKRDRSCTYQQALEVVRSMCPFIAADDMPWILGGTIAGLLRRTGDTT